jgi:hypothetical protein
MTFEIEWSIAAELASGNWSVISFPLTDKKLVSRQISLKQVATVAVEKLDHELKRENNGIIIH